MSISLMSMLLASTVLISGARTAPVRGVVFLDANANGCRDAGERGLNGVPITNGSGFEQTDSSGRFAIELVRDPVLRDGGTPIVSVRIPNGYWPTTPWFRRVPKPADGAALAFGLRRDKQSLPLLFIHGTDPHVPRKGEGRFLGFRRDVAELADRARFCILTGDLVDLSDAHPFVQACREFEFLSEQTRGFPVPLFFVTGNHDIAGVRAPTGWNRANPYYGYGFFTYRVGPLRWSFTYAGVHFVGIDFNRLADGKWVWGVPESAVRWLEADLSLIQPGTRILLFVHFPQGVASFQKVVERFGVTQIFHGHDHVDRSNRFGTVPSLSSGSIAEVFSDRDRAPGYRLVYLTKTGMETFYRATGARHAITVDNPRSAGTLKPGDPIRGAFYDPKGEIDRLSVRVGEHEQAVAFRRGPICCRFKAAVDLSGVTAGIRPVTVTITDGNVRATDRKNALVLSGHDGSFHANGDAVLEVDVGGIDRGAEVVVNGRSLATLQPTTLKGDGDFAKPVKGTDLRRLPVPGEQLRRLNQVVLRAGGNGRHPDRFCVLDARIVYNAKTFRDIRLRHGSQKPTYVATKKQFWIDLMPGK